MTKEECITYLKNHYADRLAQINNLLLSLHSEIKIFKKHKPEKKKIIKDLKREVKHNKKLSKSYFACQHLIETLERVI